MTNGHTRNKHTRGNPRPRHISAPPRAPGTAGDSRTGTASGLPNGPVKRAPARPTTTDGNANGANPHRRENSTRPRHPRTHLPASAGDQGDAHPPISTTPAPSMNPPTAWEPEEEHDIMPASPPLPAGRPHVREQGWRALPPRGIKPSNDGQRPVGQHPVGPPPFTPEAHLSAAVPTPNTPEPSAGGSTRVPMPLVAPPGHAPFRPEVRGELGPLIDALKDLFVRDRITASQGSSVRCGICYLYHGLAQVEYREFEGFYICPDCQRSIGTAVLRMVRRQQR